jgi:hypothetical protein
MRNLACSTIAILLFCSAVGAEETPFDSLLTLELARRLTQEGEVRNSLQAGAPPQLVPAVPDKGEIQSRLQSLQLTVGTEVLALYKNDGEDFDSEYSRLKIYNILRSISSMQGIEYYSASRKRMRTLFDKSYVIAGPEDPEPRPDPLVDAIPTFSELYVFQKDLTFGENVYLWEYRYPGSYCLIVNRNITTMRYFFFPMVKPLESVTYILLIPNGELILFYGASGARTMKLMGLERTREDSFYNRLKAIYGWFTDSMTAAF